MARPAAGDPSRPLRRSVPILIGILALAALARLTGLSYDLPFIYHPDEPFNVDIVQTMFRTGDLNPHLFVYPSLSYYVNAIAYVPYYYAARLVGVIQARSDIAPLVELVMGAVKAPLPSTIVLGRLLSVVFSVGTVGLTFLLGKRLLHDTRIAALAATLVAIAPPFVVLGRLITPDAFVVFFAMACVYFAARIFQEGRTWQYVAAGIAAGLAASSKYNGGLVVVSIAAAHVLRYGWAGWKVPAIYAALACASLAFVAGTPYAVIDYRTFAEFVIIDGRHYAGGHPGMEGDTLRWYLNYMATTAAVAYALAALEIGRGIVRRSKPILVLAAFPIAYFTFIALFVVRNDRTLHPLIPLAFLLAASGLVRGWDRARGLHPEVTRSPAIAGLAILVVAMVVQPAIHTIADMKALFSIDSRETARRWIADNLPRGSRIAIESYSPFVDPKDFQVQGMERAIDHEPQWFAERGFDYVVCSEGMYKRYFTDRERYSTQASRYEALFARYDPALKVFDDGNYEIRIYEVGRHLDSARATFPASR